MKKNIAILGATGMLAGPVVRAFDAAGYAVRALVRNPGQARMVLPDSIEIVQADVRDEASLTEALHGMDWLYINLSVGQTEKPTDFHPESDGMVHVISAAQATGIQRIGYLSSLIHLMEDNDWWAFEVKRQAARHLKAAEIPYRIFYPSTFMDILDRQMMQGNNLMLIRAAGQKMYWIAGTDYADQVVKSFELLSDASREYVVQGPEAYTFDEAAEIFQNNYTATALKVRYMPLGVMRFMGRFSTKMDYVTRITDALLQNPEPFAAETTWAELGTPPTTLAQYAQQVSAP